MCIKRQNVYLISHPTLHRISFTSPGLSISKDSTVETIKHFIDNRGNCLVVYRSLLWFRSENLTKQVQKQLLQDIVMITIW